MKRTEYLLFWLLVAVVVPLEWFAARIAYETLGEIPSAVYAFLICLNAPLILLSWKSRFAAAAGVVLLALVIVPYQLYLAKRLVRIQAEAARIVTFAYRHRVQTGSYPPDLSGYRFHDPAMAQFVQKYSAPEGGKTFTVTYRVGTESTSHWYSERNGWNYYPD